jgi:hypothetical protein
MAKVYWKAVIPSTGIDGQAHTGLFRYVRNDKQARHWGGLSRQVTGVVV